MEHPLNGGNYFVLPTAAGKSWINEWILRMEFSLAHGERGRQGCRARYSLAELGKVIGAAGEECSWPWAPRLGDAEGQSAPARAGVVGNLQGVPMAPPATRPPAHPHVGLYAPRRAGINEQQAIDSLLGVTYEMCEAPWECDVVKEEKMQVGGRWPWPLRWLQVRTGRSLAGVSLRIVGLSGGCHRLAGRSWWALPSKALMFSPPPSVMHLYHKEKAADSTLCAALRCPPNCCRARSGSRRRSPRSCCAAPGPPSARYLRATCARPTTGGSSTTSTPARRVRWVLRWGGLGRRLRCCCLAVLLLRCVVHCAQLGAPVQLRLWPR